MRRAFQYADYDVSRAEFVRELKVRGFRGYRCVLQRDIRRSELVPRGWRPEIRPDWNSGRLKRLLEQESRCRPFAHWSVWVRESGDPDDWFQFLFLGGEACACYQGLYLRNGVAPAVLCIIQPGSGLGGGWTRIEGDGDFFHRIVRSGPMPQYLLHGGMGRGRYYDTACWPFDYPVLVERYNWKKALRMFRRA